MALNKKKTWVRIGLKSAIISGLAGKEKQLTQRPRHWHASNSVGPAGASFNLLVPLEPLRVHAGH